MASRGPFDLQFFPLFIRSNRMFDHNMDSNFQYCKHEINQPNFASCRYLPLITNTKQRARLYKTLQSFVK